MTKPSSATRLFVSSSTPRVICHYLIEQKACPEKIEKILECSIDDLESVDFRLPISNYNQLWEFAIQFSRCPDLGLIIGCRKVEDEVGLLGHIFFSNATIEEALKQYQRYFSVTNENISIALKQEGENVALQFLCEQNDCYSIYDMERTIAAGVTRTREHVNQPLPIERIDFQHAAPAHHERYESVFECPIKFSQPCSGIVFNKQYLAFRLPHRSSYLQKVLSKHLDTLLNNVRRKNSFCSKVEALIEKRLSTDSIDAEHIAKKLNMSRNTLYRKLQNEEKSFQDLVENVRKRKAIEYLNEGNVSISQIAFLLGFSELSAFSRAFKRWTGKSPARYLESIKQ